MDQYSHYLMMMKLKKHHHILNSIHFQAAPVKSWEEQAFVEDSQGPLGGFIWPPRSYSCSFCKREFRSAQALGGHMNVHRRDRARLKQSSNSSSQTEETQVFTLASNLNNFVASAPTSAPLFSSPIIRQPHENESLHSIDVDSKKGKCKRSAFEDVETNLYVGLNNGVPRIRGVGDFSGGDGKKRKTDVVKLPILFKTCSNDKEIDLELRLGDSPIVLMTEVEKCTT